MSQVSAQVIFSARELNKYLYNQLPDTLIHDEKPNGLLGYRYTVKKVDDLDIYFLKDTIVLDFPVRVEFKQDLGPSASGELITSWNVVYELSEHWDLDASVTLKDHYWKVPLEAKVIGFSLNLEKISQVVIKQSTQQIESLINKAIREQINLPLLAEKIWTKFAQPQYVDSVITLGIALDASSINWQPYPNMTEGDNLNWPIAITGALELKALSEGQKLSATPLPALQSNYQPEPSQLLINGSIQEKQLLQLVRSGMIGKQFDTANQKITVKEVDLSIRPHDTGLKVHAKITFDGSMSGVANWTSILSISADQQNIDLTDSNITIEGANWLARQSIKLFKNQVTQRVEKEIQTEIKNYKKDGLEMLKKALYNRELTNEWWLNGNIGEPIIKNISIENKVIKLVVLQPVNFVITLRNQ